MKHVQLLILFVIIHLCSIAQFCDAFSDGNFIEYPKWEGDTAKFTITSSNQLKLNSSGIGSAFLSVKNNLIDSCQWDFWIKQSFNSSANNFGRIYLVADSFNLNNPIHGYYIQFGGYDDSVRFYKQTGGFSQPLFSFKEIIASNSLNIFRFNITRLKNGLWKFKYNADGTKNFNLFNSILDNTYNFTNYFGIYCKYTASNVCDFYFDDFSVKSISQDSVKPEETKLFEVVFNELMIDPIPSVKLPETEYIELYNRSDKLINLEGWRINISIIPTILLKPKSYLLLMPLNSNGYSDKNINVCFIKSFPVLANSAKMLVLRNNTDKIIDFINYSDQWYKNDYKKKGGWSLEKIDPENLCGEDLNWEASINMNGGTPGFENSVLAINKNTLNPYIKRIGVLNDSTILIWFNESLDSTLFNSSEFQLYPNIKILSFQWENFSYNCLQLVFNGSLKTTTLYTLKLPSDAYQNCCGNKGLDAIIQFALPENASSKDVLINELLFNPRDDGVCFIEIYNNSHKVIDLKDLVIAKWNESYTKLIEVSEINSTSFLFFPQEYKLLSINSSKVKEQYKSINPEAFITMGSFPSLLQDSGFILIANKNEEPIDQMRYNSNMHFKGLTNVKGVSLERINFNTNSLDINNWHSATANVGFATPGYKNSEFLDTFSLKNEFFIYPRTFTPDNDGKDDVLQIHYHFNLTQNTGTITVFDSYGHKKRLIATNELMATSGDYFWDGTDDNGKKCAIGIYILFAEVLEINGKLNHYKLPFVLGGQF